MRAEIHRGLGAATFCDSRETLLVLQLLTGEQIRAARALVRLEQSDLARLSGLSIDTIKRLERIRGQIDAHSRTVVALHRTFDALGVRFITVEGGGVGVGLHPAAD
jgi:transcriptional regulator with XRE-family HTH domain